MSTAPSTPAKPPWTIKRTLLRALLAAFVIFMVVYFGDTLWFHVRYLYPAAGPATGSVHRVRLLAVPLKNYKVDYEIDSQQPEEDVPCAHSLFSHAGMRPCWYVTRHANDPIPM